MIAALYVQHGGVYFGLPGVDPWDEQRDARHYPGPWPVVAHPPCGRWCRLAGLVEARWGHRQGDDGGCFAAALDAVRRWGGVLEHPAHTKAFAAFGIPAPRRGGWQGTLCGGFVCAIDQGQYGHPAKKATWLYAFGISDLPSLPWATVPDCKSSALVSWCGNKVKRDGRRARISKAVASRTPPAFRDLLLGVATSAATSRNESAPHRALIAHASDEGVRYVS